MAMDKLNTKVSMTLHDYENLKEYQQNCREMHKEIKSIVNINDHPGENQQVIINKQRLEKFLIKIFRTDLHLALGEEATILFEYE